MTDHDFICWLRGFSAAFAGCPSAEGWELICEQLAAVGAAPVSQLVRPGQIFGPIFGAHGPQPTQPL